MQNSKHITLFSRGLIYNFLLLILVLFFLFPSNTNAQNFDKTDWKLKTTKGNLKVYTRKNENSDVKEIRITTSINAPLTKVLEVLNDVSKYPKWVFKCMEAKKVKVNSSFDYVYYSKYDFPFPFVDRDIVVHSNQWEDEKNGVLYSHSKATTSDMFLEKKGVVRITLLDAYWKITPQKDGTLAVDYIALTDPAGKLPSWIVNLGITKGSTETLKRFRALVEPQPKLEVN